MNHIDKTKNILKHSVQRVRIPKFSITLGRTNSLLALRLLSAGSAQTLHLGGADNARHTLRVTLNVLCKACSYFSGEHLSLVRDVWGVVGRYLIPRTRQPTILAQLRK